MDGPRLVLMFRRALLFAFLAALFLGAAPSQLLAGEAQPDAEAAMPAPEGLVTVVTRDGFRFVATPAAAGAAEALSRKAGEIRQRITGTLGKDYDGITEVRVAHSRSSFAAIQPGGSHVPSWAAGIAYPSLNVIVLNSQGGPGRSSVGQVMIHEISHIALGRLAPERFPRWFLEGVATWHADEFDLGRATVLAAAVVQNEVIPIDDLSDGWPNDPPEVHLAYAQSIDFVGWMMREHGKDSVQNLVQHVVDGDDFKKGLELATGQELWRLEKDWVASVRLRHTWIPAVTSTGFIWGLTSLLFLWASWRKRKALTAQIEAMSDGPMLEIPEQSEDLEGEAPEEEVGARIIEFPGSR